MCAQAAAIAAGVAKPGGAVGAGTPTNAGVSDAAGGGAGGGGGGGGGAGGGGKSGDYFGAEQARMDHEEAMAKAAVARPGFKLPPSRYDDADGEFADADAVNVGYSLAGAGGGAGGAAGAEGTHRSVVDELLLSDDDDDVDSGGGGGGGVDLDVSTSDEELIQATAADDSAEEEEDMGAMEAALKQELRKCVCVCVCVLVIVYAQPFCLTQYFSPSSIITEATTARCAQIRMSLDQARQQYGAVRCWGDRSCAAVAVAAIGV